MTRRLNSSSQGRLEVAGPQSRLNMRNWHPAKEAGYRCGVAVAVFPWTTTQSYYPRSNACSICRLISPSLLPSPGCCITLVPALKRHGYVKKVEQARCQLQVLIGPEHVHRHRRFRRSAWQTGPSLIISGRAPNATSMRMGSAFLIASHS